MEAFKPTVEIPRVILPYMPAVGISNIPSRVATLLGNNML
jgi:hypothetical protein